jgi:hypothetical protein
MLFEAGEHKIFEEKDGGEFKAEVVEIGPTEPLGQLLPAGRIFVRKCYTVLFPVLWGRFEKNRSRVTISLTGTPGIGKSIFGLLFLIELVRFLKTSDASPENLASFGLGLNGHIVYEHVSGPGGVPTYFLIDAGADTIHRTRKEPTTWLADSHAFLLKDGPCPDFIVDCSVLWVSSPRAGSFQKAGEKGEKKFILPPWDADELVECWSRGCAPKELFDLGADDDAKDAREAVQDSLHALDDDADEAAQHEAILRRWTADLGPVARRVFSPAKGYSKLRAALDVDLGDLDGLAKIAQSQDAGGDASKFQHSHRLLLMIPSKDLTVFEFAPSSVSIGRKILRKKLEDDLESARTLMGKMSGTHLGLIFEPYAHFVLSKERTFKIRSLHNSEEEEFKTSTCETVEISNQELGALKLEPDTYYIPIDPTFAVIDSWSLPAMYQMTVTPTHPIKSGSNQFKALKSKGPTRIIFVVPRILAAEFKLQPLVTANGKRPADKAGPRGGWNDVQQFVLGL